MSLPWKKSHIFFFLVVVVYFGVFLIYPVLDLTKNAFWTSEEGFTLAFLFSVFRDPALLATIVRSFMIALAVTGACLVIALPLSYLVAKFSFPGKSIINGMTLIPLILPPFVGALGLKQFFARFGSVNLILMDLGIISQPIDWFGSMGFWGVVFLEAVHLYPIMFLNLTSALSNVDPALEEAAESQGASPWKVFRSVTFPLMLPGFFAGAIIVFVWAFTDLGTPLMMGYREVVPVQIFQKVGEVGQNPQGFALVIVVLLVTAATFLLSHKLVKGTEFAMVSKGGAGGSTRKVGPIQLTGIYVLFAFVVFISVLPHVGLILNSFRSSWFMTVLPESYTFAHYEQVLEHPLTLPSIFNSIRYSLFSTLIDIFLGLWIAFMLVRKKVFGARLLDAIAMLPLALPGIVLAFGYVSCFLGWDGPMNSIFSFVLAPFYGGSENVPTFILFDPKTDPALLLILAYSVRRLPFIVRSAYAGFQQISETFEEASSSLGGKPLYTLRRITVPLLAGNLVVGALLTFIFAMLEVSDSLIIAFTEADFPLTKAIYALAFRLGDGSFVASAMGVWCMLLLTCGLLISSIVLGNKMGQLFRAS